MFRVLSCKTVVNISYDFLTEYQTYIGFKLVLDLHSKVLTNYDKNRMSILMADDVFTFVCKQLQVYCKKKRLN